MITIKIEASAEGVSESVDVCMVEFQKLMDTVKEWRLNRLVNLCNTPCSRYKVSS